MPFGADILSAFIGSAGEVHLSNGVAVSAFRVAPFGSEIIPFGAAEAHAFVEGFQIAAAREDMEAGGLQDVAGFAFGTNAKLSCGE